MRDAKQAAKELWLDLANDPHTAASKLAAFIERDRAEVRAEAFGEAAKALEHSDLECYCSQHDEYPEGLCYIKARAASSAAIIREK